MICGDLNIDQWGPNDLLSRYDLAQLNEVLVDIKNDHLLDQMNFKPTRFQAGRNPSLLDLFLSNQPEHIDSVETINANIADHKLVKI